MTHPQKPTFYEHVTKVPVSYANIVGTVVYDVLQCAATAADARVALGLGDMSQQDTGHVNIHGGTINGTSIGASVPSTGRFTTLTITEPGTSSDSVVNRSWVEGEISGQIAVLSLGSMSRQNANAVSITGGTGVFDSLRVTAEPSVDADVVNWGVLQDQVATINASAITMPQVEAAITVSVNAAVAGLIDGAPEALNTLKEISDLLLSESDTTQALITNLAVNTGRIGQLTDDVIVLTGQLGDLTQRVNVLAAGSDIGALSLRVDTLEDNQGDLTALVTTDKTTLVDSINETHDLALLASLGSTQTFVAGEALSGHQVVTMDIDGNAVKADSTNPAHYAITGITLNAAATGEQVKVVRVGSLNHSGWAFTPGSPVFVGAGGAVVQTLPGGAVFSKLLGQAVSPTRITLDFQQPIFLA